MGHPADKFIKTVRGAFVIVKYCTVSGCNFSHVRRKGVGRGSGFREGNKARGIMIQHIKTEHPELLQSTTEETST